MVSTHFDGYDCKKKSRLVHSGPKTMSAKTRDKIVTAVVSTRQAVDGFRDLLFHLPHCIEDVSPDLVKMKGPLRAPHVFFSKCAEPEFYFLFY